MAGLTTKKLLAMAILHGMATCDFGIDDDTDCEELYHAVVDCANAAYDNICEQEGIHCLSFSGETLIDIGKRVGCKIVQDYDSTPDVAVIHSIIEELVEVYHG